MRRAFAFVRRGNIVSIIASVALVLLFLTFGLRDGIPILRHDWGLPYSAAGWRAFAVATTSGWSQNGIGHPRPYPTLYLLGPLLALIGILLGSFWAAAAFLAVVALLLVGAARKLARVFGAPRWFGISLATASLFNPWMYEKLVAGHLTMMLSLAVCFFTASSLVAGEVSPVGLFVCGYVAAFQIQYGLLAGAILFIIVPSFRVAKYTAAGALTSLLPSIIGISLEHSFLRSIPFSVPWQINNSVPLGQGMLLDGYSSNYTLASKPMFILAGAFLLASALMAVPVCVRSIRHRKLVLRVAVGATATLLFCSGLRGPLAAFYSVMLKFRPILVFRELFDLIGIVAIGYFLLASLAAGKSRIARFCVAGAAMLFLVAWTMSPPYRQFVSANAVPKIRIYSRTTNLRFSLMPWMQPLRFKRRGSGSDPDIFTHANNFSSLNEYQYSYPVGEAIASYLRTKDAVALEDLSVSRIYSRPYFSSDQTTIENGDPADALLPQATGSKRLSPQPELALTNVPPSSDRLHRFETPYLFGDGDPIRFLRFVRPVEPPLDSINPRQAWVAVAEASPAFPGIGNSFGGAFTLNGHAKLALPEPRPIATLVRVQGKLLGSGRLLSSNTKGWEWVGLGRAKSLQCRGRCAVVLWQTHRFPALQKRPKSHVPTVPIHFWQIAPFALIGHIKLSAPTAHRSLVLFRSRYDAAWVLFGIPSLEHVDYSMVFNGYEIGRGFNGGAFLLINTTALFQAAAMILSVLALAIAFATLPSDPIGGSWGG